jgi:hypothetical protein
VNVVGSSPISRLGCSSIFFRRSRFLIDFKKTEKIFLETSWKTNCHSVGVDRIDLLEISS